MAERLQSSYTFETALSAFGDGDNLGYLPLIAFAVIALVFGIMMIPVGGYYIVTGLIIFVSGLILLVVGSAMKGPETSRPADSWSSESKSIAEQQLGQSPAKEVYREREIIREIVKIRCR